MFNIDLLLLNIFNFPLPMVIITPFPFLKLDMDYNFFNTKSLYENLSIFLFLVLISNVGNFLGILDICSVRGLI